MNAYLIAGHGTEPAPSNIPEEPSRIYDPTKPTPSKFVVPDGCTIIVQKRPYEVATGISFSNAVHKLTSLPNKVITNPTGYTGELIKALGSVAIYPAGSTCSNFEYTTQLCYPEHSICDGQIGSGINDVIKMKGTYSSYRTNTFRGKSSYQSIKLDPFYTHSEALKGTDIDDIEDLVYFLYRYSVYPKKVDITENIQKHRASFNSHKVGLVSNFKKQSLLTELLRHLRRQDFSTITQQALCNKFPGVYYNFVCRYTEGTHNIDFHNKEGEVHSIRNTLRYSNSNTQPHNVKNRTVRLLQARIQEAELHRKPHLKSFYMKDISDKKEQLRKTRKFHKAIINNVATINKNYEDFKKSGRTVSQSQINNVMHDKNRLQTEANGYQKEINEWKHLNQFTPLSKDTSPYIQITNNNGSKHWTMPPVLEAELFGKRHARDEYANELSDEKEQLKRMRNTHTRFTTGRNKYIEDYEASGKNKSQNDEYKKDMEYFNSEINGYQKGINRLEYLNHVVLPSNKNTRYTRMINKNGKVKWNLAANRTRKNE